MIQFKSLFLHYACFTSSSCCVPLYPTWKHILVKNHANENSIYGGTFHQTSTRNVNGMNLPQLRVLPPIGTLARHSKCLSYDGISRAWCHHFKKNSNISEWLAHLLSVCFVSSYHETTSFPIIVSSIVSLSLSLSPSLPSSFRFVCFVQRIDLIFRFLNCMLHNMQANPSVLYDNKSNQSNGCHCVVAVFSTFIKHQPFKAFISNL